MNKAKAKEGYGFIQLHREVLFKLRKADDKVYRTYIELSANCNYVTKEFSNGIKGLMRVTGIKTEVTQGACIKMLEEMQLIVVKRSKGRKSIISVLG